MRVMHVTTELYTLTVSFTCDSAYYYLVMPWAQCCARISPLLSPNSPLSQSPFLDPHPLHLKTLSPLLGLISSSFCFHIWASDFRIKEGEGGCIRLCLKLFRCRSLPTPHQPVVTQCLTCFSCVPFMPCSFQFLNIHFKPLCICIFFCQLDTS